MSGVIQLAEGSHVTIDETQLQAGTLKAVGVENTRLLKNLVELQKVISNLCPACIHVKLNKRSMLEATPFGHKH